VTKTKISPHRFSLICARNLLAHLIAWKLGFEAAAAAAAAAAVAAASPSSSPYDLDGGSSLIKVRSLSP